MLLRNFGFLSHHYTASQPEDGGSMILRNVGILSLYYTALQPEDGGSLVLRNLDANGRLTITVRPFVLCNGYEVGRAPDLVRT
jgi:hypothetical protein